MPHTDDAALQRHLTAWLGAWPPPAGEVVVTASPRRSQPGWDGRVHPLIGVVSPGGAVLSVAPDRVEPVRDVVGQRGVIRIGEVLPHLRVALDLLDAHTINGVFRWTAHPTPMHKAGEWFSAEDPAVPPWLKPFGGEALLAMEDGAYIGGVGLKRHDRTGEEIAVGTEERARGKGLARRLVSQAARRVLERADVVTYLHAPENTASARVADAAGFPDLGWRVLAVAPR